MKSEKEIREMIDKLIQWAVECSSEMDEDNFINQAVILGWVLGINGADIQNQFENALEARYVEV